ncbi:MAG: hypothetical protein K2H56_02550, partial [Malacoplasma sp.]|nr:hypothetical protein [Malacoplasma sp.]
IECAKIYKNTNSSISFLIVDNFKIHRTNSKNKEKIMEKSNEFFNFFLNKEYESKEIVFKDLDKETKYNIFLNGIGIVAIKNVQEIKINFPKHFEIELLKNFII